MKKYISPSSNHIRLSSERAMLLTISVNGEIDVDDDDKTSRQNSTIWDDWTEVDN